MKGTPYSVHYRPSNVGTHPFNAPAFSAATINGRCWPDGILATRPIGNDGAPFDFNLRVSLTPGSRIVLYIALYRVLRAIGSIHRSSSAPTLIGNQFVGPYLCKPGAKQLSWLDRTRVCHIVD